MEGSSQLYTQVKSPWYQLDRRLGGPQSRCECGEEKNSQPLPGLKLLIIQPIAQCYTTELYQLLKVSSIYLIKYKMVQIKVGEREIFISYATAHCFVLTIFHTINELLISALHNVGLILD
jgi:hypothetical protein